ncbi:hypothetical protein ACIO3R_22940 [Streptomyces sp. NPDC087428]|uniref:hypothetical protein n=1 Tax=Streptomyces sp. NPDC087428 TaxID=3365788 RepID=UPI0038030758
MRQRSRGRATLAAVAAMCAVAALPGQAYGAGGPAAYRFDPKAEAVSGAVVSTDATELTAGSVYRSSIKFGQKLYYRLNLEATTNAYVSAVVVPKDGGKVAYGDGIAISIRDNSDLRCSSENAHFESAEYPRPIAAYAYRNVNKGSSGCQGAGRYNVLIERESEDTSGRGDWELEIRYASEPQLAKGGSTPTEAPENWPSASPEPPTPVKDNRRHGGSGYYDATSLETGEWRDEVVPGQTLFYRIPVDWGQQIFATAGLGNSTVPDENDYVSGALAMSLDNPAHGRVDNASPMSYSGKPASMSLDPVPPVAYQNRFASRSSVSAMRFAGWYYLSVTLSPEVAKPYGSEPFPLTLSVKVEGTAREKPYAGDAGIFGVTQGDKDMARSGQSGPQAAESKSSSMKLLGAAGIGAGAVLVLGLGGWTLLARRGQSAAAAPAGAADGGQQHPYGGPPQAW